MDVKYINPFIESFNTVMPQIGFNDTKGGNISVKSKEVIATGVLIIIGVIGKIKGNVVYTIDIDSAKKIASTMMMTQVDVLDEMVESALSELANMLTATAATVLSNNGITIDISTPTLLHGENICAKMNSDTIICVKLLAGDISIEINISYEK